MDPISAMNATIVLPTEEDKVSEWINTTFTSLMLSDYTNTDTSESGEIITTAAARRPTPSNFSQTTTFEDVCPKEKHSFLIDCYCNKVPDKPSPEEACPQWSQQTVSDAYSTGKWYDVGMQSTEQWLTTSWTTTVNQDGQTGRVEATTDGGPSWSDTLYTEQCKTLILSVDCSELVDEATSEVALSENTRLILLILLLVLCVIGIGANALVLSVMASSRHLRSRSHAFLINLTASDLLVCSLLLPAAIHGASRPDIVVNPVVCQLFSLISSVVCLISTFSVMVIAYDRYHAIINCLEYNSQSSRSYVMRGLAVVYLQALLYSLPPHLGWAGLNFHPHRLLCSVDWSGALGYAIFAFLAMFSLPLCTMIYCYMCIIRIARQHVRRIADINIHAVVPPPSATPAAALDTRGVLAYAMVDPVQRLSIFPEIMVLQSTNEMLNRSNERGETGHNGQGSNPATYGDIGFQARVGDTEDNMSNVSTASSVCSSLKREARATVKLLGLVAIFITCWLPYHLTNMYSATHRPPTPTYQAFPLLDSLALIFALSKSVLNPFMYTLSSKRIRHTMKKKLKLHRRKKKRNTTLRSKQRQVHSRIASLYHNRQSVSCEGQRNNNEADGYRATHGMRGWQPDLTFTDPDRTPCSPLPGMDVADGEVYHVDGNSMLTQPRIRRSITPQPSSDEYLPPPLTPPSSGSRDINGRSPLPPITILPSTSECRFFKSDVIFHNIGNGEKSRRYVSSEDSLSLSLKFTAEAGSVDDNTIYSPSHQNSSTENETKSNAQQRNQIIHVKPKITVQAWPLD